MKGEGGRRPTVEVDVKGLGVFRLPRGATLRRALRAEGIHLDGTCSDNGTCGRCTVRILDGEAGPVSEAERGLLGDRLRLGERFACQVRLEGPLAVAVAPERLLQFDRSGLWKETWESPLWRDGLWPLSFHGYGVALDLGTTALAAALYEMGTGRPVDLAAAGNPQARWGDDILSRLEAAARSVEEGRLLAEALWAEVGRMVGLLCVRNGISPGRVLRMSAVGNSAMATIAMGRDPSSLLVPPFAPPSTDAVRVRVSDLPIPLKMPPSTEIVFPPLVGGFVGSDALVGAMAARVTGIRTGALLDVGTNTEIVVWRDGRAAAASAPAGPAFEGVGIRRGMRAEEGAVWRVSLDGAEVHAETVGGVPARGICGTGLVDAAAVLVRGGMVDSSGRPRPGSHPALGPKGLVVVPGADIVVGGRELEAVQKAKAAVAASLRTVLDGEGLRFEDLDRLVLAGAFGSRLDPESAAVIGLLPRLPKGRVLPAGNAALVGGSWVLLSAAAEAEAERLAGTITHVSVAESPAFQERYLDELFFPGSQGGD